MWRFESRWLGLIVKTGKISKYPLGGAQETTTEQQKRMKSNRESLNIAYLSILDFEAYIRTCGSPVQGELEEFIVAVSVPREGQEGVFNV